MMQLHDNEFSLATAQNDQGSLPEESGLHQFWAL